MPGCAGASAGAGKYLCDAESIRIHPGCDTAFSTSTINGLREPARARASWRRTLATSREAREGRIRI